LGGNLTSQRKLGSPVRYAKKTTNCKGILRTEHAAFFDSTHQVTVDKCSLLSTEFALEEGIQMNTRMSINVGQTVGRLC